MTTIYNSQAKIIQLNHKIVRGISNLAIIVENVELTYIFEAFV